jgi:hypothetical protein
VMGHAAAGRTSQPRNKAAASAVPTSQ